MKQLTVQGLAGFLVIVTLLAACTTTTTTTSGLPEARDARAAAETGDPERRANVRLELAGLYFQRGQGETALEEVNRALAAKADLPSAHNLRGLILASLDQPVAAEKAFQRALQLAPEDGATLHNYGWFLCQQRRFSEGDTQFNAAMAQPQDRDTPRTYLAQGVCQARAGQWGDAERSLSLSYELEATHSASALLRAGVLSSPDVLWYGIAGYTHTWFNGDLDIPGIFSASYDFDEGGLTAGAGVEVMLTDNVSWKSEYRYTNLGDVNIFSGGGFTLDSATNIQQVRSVLTYRF